MAFSEQTSPDERNPYTILASPHRRHALHILGDAESPLALADLAADIAGRESKDANGDIDWKRIKRIHTALYHNHIPRCAELGLVEFNAARQTVTLSDSASSAEGPLSIYQEHV